MKLIIAIIRDVDADATTQALTDASFRVTRIASTGGLLRRGVTTLLIGVEDDRVEAGLQTLKEACSPPGKARSAPRSSWSRSRTSPKSSLLDGSETPRRSLPGRETSVC
jgi:uncharacterized protein YaaQ